MAPEASLTDRLVAGQFGTEGSDLLIGGIPARVLAERFGTPLFAYDAALIRASYRALAAAIEGFAGIHYSIKANPNPAVVRVLHEEGAGIEIASLGEFRAARTAGVDPAHMLFAGPGKRRAELEAVIGAGIGEIHLESREEMAHAAAIGAALGRRVAVAIRVNPVAEAQGGAMRMGGKAAPFGFDEEDLEAVVDAVAASPHLDLTGVHFFAGTQILDAAVLLGQWRHGLAVASRAAARLGRPLRTIDLGGGLGIPYFAGDGTLDLAAVKAGLPDLVALKAADPLIRNAHVLVEPGRYLVGASGVYLAAVLSAKLSRGQRFLVVDGGMHHHLAASGNLGQVIKRDYPVVAASRVGEPSAGPASVVGPLCTPLDTLARKVEMPAMAEGDLVAVLQSGAYGPTASPVGFLSHPAAAEVLVDGGEARLISQAQ
ncbi:type III PLP-dependent enzyme [Phreatobacter cathodiphilus]|uniref:Type III PLP-dependent enzyme n=1 Tax=Phreatobacter cathodiphilus TaxID=1868589 RepID=A0A2S0N6F3_9HYPH|nr:type III PLP-dependent enzyme [Phreatobacter cathodiphilus]AVO43728.1 type III PLP-dependent enzyme [Phreatobacter cathodiphilus]